MKALILFLLCWFAASIIMAVGFVLGRSIGRSYTTELPKVIPLKGTKDLPYIEVVWGDGTKTRHYIQRSA